MKTADCSNSKCLFYLCKWAIKASNISSDPLTWRGNISTHTQHWRYVYTLIAFWITFTVRCALAVAMNPLILNITAFMTPGIFQIAKIVQNSIRSFTLSCNFSGALFMWCWNACATFYSDVLVCSELCDDTNEHPHRRRSTAHLI